MRRSIGSAGCRTDGTEGESASPAGDTVLVRIEYPVPASELDLAATAAVLAASEQGCGIVASEQSGIMPRLPVSSFPRPAASR